jgi:predicted PurR-regulated permease PerM
MNNQLISLQRVGFALLIVFLVGYIVVIGSSVLIPVTFGAFFALMLMPVCNFLERWIPWRIPVIFLTFLLALIPVSGVATLLSIQLVDVVNNLPAIGGKMQSAVGDIFIWLHQNFDFSQADSEQWISENLSSIFQTPLSFLGRGVSLSTTFFANLALTIIYTFFFLLYRSAFKRFALIQSRREKRDEMNALLNRIQHVVQKYLYGILMVMLILGILNSTALWLIGIEYALFWGFLAGILAVIPYIGTFIGALLPFLYALATTGNLWQPALVVLAFNFIQALETNIITPKVAGSSVKLNPLASVLGLIVAGTMWGVAGLVLALPIIAVIKVLMEQIDFLKPFSFLLSSDVYGKGKHFEQQYDDDRFRLLSFFKRKPPHE